MARFRLPVVLLLVLAGVMTALAVCLPFYVQRSVSGAIDDSVRANLGGHRYAVQAGTSEARALLASQHDLVPIRDAAATLSTGGAQASATARFIPDSDLMVGSLVDGRRPAKPGEVSVSRYVAQALGLRLGDQVSIGVDSLDSQEYTVVGLTADAADAYAATVTVLDPDLRSVAATTWLTDVDPSSLPQLREVMETRSVSYQSLAGMADSAGGRLPVSAQALSTLPWALGGLFVAFCVGLVAMMARIGRRDVESLQAVGYSPRRAWLQIATLAGVCLGIGVLGGSAMAAFMVNVWSRQISRWFAQDWVAVTNPLWPSLVLLVLCFCWILVLHRMVMAVQGTRRWLQAHSGAASARVIGAAALTAAAGIVLLGLAFSAHRQDPPTAASGVAPFAAALVALGLPVLLLHGLSQGLAPALRQIVRSVGTGVAFSASVAGLIGVLAGSYASVTRHDTVGLAGLSNPIQPPGSFLATDVSGPAADQIAAQYRSAGGEELRVFTLLDESDHQLRAAAPLTVDCLTDDFKDITALPDRCLSQRTFSPINTVAFSDEADSDRLADPELLAKGKIGLLEMSPGSPVPTRLDLAAANPDFTLGGNMPGLVIPQEDPLVADYGLRPGETRTVALLGFGQLPANDRARLRAFVARVAPSAQIAENTSDRAIGAQLAVSNAAAVAGAALVFLTVLAGGAAAAESHRRTRRILSDLGSTNKARMSLFARLVAVGGLQMVAIAALAFVGAVLAGVNVEASYGVGWALPALAGLCATCLVSGLLLHLPARTTSG